MKNLILSIFILFVLPNKSFSQWTLQNSGTNNTLFSVDFLTESSGWIAGTDDLIKQTRDGGQSWSDFSDRHFPSYEWWLNIFIVNENDIYACGDIAALGGTQSYWIYTTNGGDSWVRQMGSMVPESSFWSDVFFLNNNLGWRVGHRNSEGRVHRTTTGVSGAWQSLITVPEVLSSVMFINENLGWVVGSNGRIYNSTDGGTNLTIQNSGTTKDLSSVYFINSSIGWCVGDGDGQAIILKTLNGGQTWSSTLPQNITKLYSIYFWDTNIGWACGSISSSSSDKGVILYTDNGGETWEVQHIENNCTELYDIDFVSNTTGWVVGSNGVILKTKSGEDDLEFKPLANMNYARFGAGYTFDGNYIYSVSGGISDSPWLSKSIDRYNLTNDTWTEFTTGLIPRGYCSAEYVSSQNKIYIFNGNTYTGVTYTDTIEIVNAGTGTISYSASNPYPVEYGGSAVWNDKIYVFGGSNSGVYSNRLYEFDPQSDSWTRLPDMEEAKQTSGRIIDGVLYVFGGYNGSVSKRIDAYDIQSSSWEKMADMPVGISAHATVGHCKYVWLVGSYDNIQSLAVYDTETNIFTQLSSDMIGRRHSGSVVARDNLYIFGGNQASSNSSALQSLEFTELYHYCITDAIEEIMTPVDFRLNQNYPNPFNPTTTIHYSLPEESHITITVFDMLGKKVNQVISSVQPAGSHSIQWNGTDHNGNPVSTGIYLYQIQTGDFIQTKKMVLMK